MYRRVVWALVACGLLIQSAPHSHAHAGDLPAGHDLRPHVHTTSPDRRESAHRHHCPDGHHHDYDGQDDHLSPDMAVPVTPEPASDHDDDAVYLADDPIGLARDGSGINAMGPSDLDVLYTPVGCSVGPATHLNLRPHPPPAGVQGCRLYVLHLALLL